MGISSDGILVLGFDLGLEDEHPPFLKDGNEDFAVFLARFGRIT
jgi:hypothetical protein